MKLCYKCQSYYDENMTECPFCAKKYDETKDDFVFAPIADIDPDTPIPEAESSVPAEQFIESSPEDNDIPTFNDKNETTDEPFEDNPITKKQEDIIPGTEVHTDNDINPLLFSQFNTKTDSQSVIRENNLSSNGHITNKAKTQPKVENCAERDFVSSLRLSVNTGGSMIFTVFDFIFLALCLVFVPVIWLTASDSSAGNETVVSLLLSGFTVLLSVCFLKNTVYSLHGLVFTPLSVILISFFSLIFGSDDCFAEILFVIPASLCIQSLIILLLSYIRKIGEKSVQTFLLYLLPLIALASVGLVSGEKISSESFLPIIFLISSSTAILISSVFEHFGLPLLLCSAFPGAISIITNSFYEEGTFSEPVFLLLNAFASFLPMLILCLCLWAGVSHFPGKEFDHKAIFFLTLSVCQLFSLLISFLIKEQNAYAEMNIITVLTQSAHLICLACSALVNVTVYFMLDKFLCLDFSGRRKE